jgi:signal peptidase I
LSFYAWEAAHLPDGRRPHPHVHAVSVSERTSNDGSIRRGDRNSNTYCGMWIGQRTDEIRYRDGYRIHSHLQLHRAADIAWLERCRRCVAAVERGRHYPYIEVRPQVEWIDDMPLFPGEPVKLDVPCAAPWPVYYRYRVEGARFWVPDASWLEAEPLEGEPSPVRAAAATMCAVGIALSAAPESVPQWQRDADASIEWHRPRRLERTAEELEYARQRAVQERRRRAMREQWQAIERNDPEVLLANATALHLLEDVVGKELVEQLAREGHLDIESRIFRDRGYRIRPWKRVGALERGSDGAWRELNRSWCFHPDDLYPMADEVLTVYLSLRFDEVATLRVANLHREAA